MSCNTANTQPERPVQAVIQHNEHKEVLAIIGHPLRQTVVPHGCQETQQGQGTEKSWKERGGGSEIKIRRKETEGGVNWKSNKGDRSGNGTNKGGNMRLEREKIDISREVLRESVKTKFLHVPAMEFHRYSPLCPLMLW